MIIPKCPDCKSQKNVKMEAAYTKEGTRFLISWCTKCLCVAEADFSARIAKEEEK